MYNEYFGLRETPFSIAPDPRYLFMSNQHKEALAHLLYGVKSDGGFVLLTGEVGTGKTTVCRCLLEQMPEECDLAFILNPRLTVDELLSTICDELGIRYPKGNKSIKVFVDCINAYLLEAHSRGRKAVLIIDEAQNLSTDVLEQMRLLTNLETNQRKLLQIILLGQPELRDILNRPELRQLAQRIVARHHLGPLSQQEVEDYVNHRLAVAGVRQKLFPPGIIAKLHHLSGGIPRLINIICDRALLGAYVQGKEKVDFKTLKNAAHEILGKIDPARQKNERVRTWMLVSLAVLVLLAFTSSLYFKDGALSFLPSSDFIRSWQKSHDGPQHRKPIPDTNNPELHSQKLIALPGDKEPSQSGAEANSPKDSSAATPQQEQPPLQAPVEQPATLAEAAPAQTSEEPIGQAALAEDVKSGGDPILLDGASDQTTGINPEEKLPWDRSEPILNSEASAYQALLKQWNIIYGAAGKETACKQAESSGLRCLTAQGSLEDLRKSNRPAVLKFSDPRGGRDFHATIVAFEDSAATMIIKDETVNVPLDEMALRWKGEYAIFWRPPPKFEGLFRKGDKGPAVEWLVARLASVQGKPAPPSEDVVFDDFLIGEVKKFQLASGLRPDGIVGPQTLIRLDAVSASDPPLLTEKKKDQ